MKEIILDKISKYTHLSNYKITKLYKKEQINDFKPIGFYFAKKTEWLEHELNKKIVKIKNNIIKIPYNYYIYKVKFDKTNMLKINSLEKLIEFTEKYAFKKYDKIFLIDWIKLEKIYDGIIISNYHKINNNIIKNKNLDIMKYTWFNMLDINGGCIWNTDIIKIKLLI